MKLLSPCNSGPIASSSRIKHSYQDVDDSESSSDSPSSPLTPVDSYRHFCDSSKPSQTIIFIDLLPEHINTWRSYDQTSAEDTEISEMDTVVRLSPHPRPFHSIDPTVTFLSPSRISARSSFIVRFRGVVVFKETTALTAIGPVPGGADGSLLYSTKLVPGFWDRLSESAGKLASSPYRRYSTLAFTISPDPTQYTISQEIVQEGEGQATPSTTFSAIYKFKYPSEASSQHHQLPDHSQEITPMFDIPSPISLDSILSMTDLTSFDVMDCGASDHFYDLLSLDTNPKSWDMSSPSHILADLAIPGYDFSEDDLSSLSPASACYSIDISNYVHNVSHAWFPLLYRCSHTRRRYHDGLIFYVEGYYIPAHHLLITPLQMYYQLIIK